MKTSLQRKPAAWLYKYRQDIDLEPFFQRGTVWSPNKQQYFMDSILKNWGTPKLFLWQSGPESFACLDGKQRLTSLFKFMADDLEVNANYSANYGGKLYSELPTTVQDAIDKYKFSIELVTQANQKEVVELYRRLQGGTPLNFGEKLFASLSQMNTWIKEELAARKFFRKIVALPNTRYSHYAVCAQLCLLSIGGAREDLKLNNLEKFFADYENFNKRSPEAAKVRQVLTFLEKAFHSRNEIALRNRPSIVSAFFLVSDLLARRNLAGKEKEIGTFFRKFTQQLQKEFDKVPSQRDPELLSYQSAVTQGADKIKYVKVRHNILLKRLAEKNQFFFKLINPMVTPEQEFSTMYEEIRIALGMNNSAAFDSWLITQGERSKYKCRTARNDETLIGHIRHCIHHSRHGRYSKPQLANALRWLKKRRLTWGV
ncbi:MAG: DUF262 domain-containing protein [Pyrinomonadaceae bacterium]